METAVNAVNDGEIKFTFSILKSTLVTHVGPNNLDKDCKRTVLRREEI
jgi:hypothetical protein